jgi:hypothetical protein
MSETESSAFPCLGMNDREDISKQKMPRNRDILYSLRWERKVSFGFNVTDLNGMSTKCGGIFAFKIAPPLTMVFFVALLSAGQQMR